ncbi:MAG: UDP-4-amino-4,6-dideoxy-N-acetyl-beta-L-altrosamine N-acetyltransferase [Verrucomicrobia bacterium GWF2_62_7]|nr:MAG: UDP-4-amino-4,6-dideoxy-N-acetyl-beta-L-altrosamine N-acetyltransferase [Verrucomicrobia bacterium GWF2_62_7]
MNLAAPRLKLGGLTLLNFSALDPRAAAAVLRWRNSPGVRRWMYSVALISKEEHAAFRRRLRADRENVYWLVKSEGRANNLGVIYLNRIDRAAGSAYLGIYANPESARPGKGAALMDALLRAAFGGLRLRTLKLEVFADNLKAAAFYKRCGFRAGRLLKGRARRGSRIMDVRVMSLKRKDWSDGDGI